MKRVIQVVAVVAMMAAVAFGQGEAAGMPAGRPKNQRRPMGSPSGAVEQSPTPGGPSPDKITILTCGIVLDVDSGKKVAGPIVIKGDKILGVGQSAIPPFSGPPGLLQQIDLRNSTCLPGLIDTHTHVMLNGDITAEDYDEQLLKESTAYRAILATRNIKRALNYGFTTLRDLETEGAGYSDVDVKTAINRGVVPGPRMQVATRALDVTGSYPLQGYNWQIQVPHGVQFCDGAEECRVAVREQTGHGADWIKVYVDRSYYVDEGNPHPPATEAGRVGQPGETRVGQPALTMNSATSGPPRPEDADARQAYEKAKSAAGSNPILLDVPTFTLDELKAIVDETHREHKKIAAHAMALYGVHNAVEAGVDSIEHGDYISPDDMATMKAKGIWYVPTMFVGEYVSQGRAQAGAPVWVQMVNINGETFKRALQMGIKIAFGTDAGGFDWAIDPAKEFSVRVKWGQSPAAAIRSATIDAATLLGMDKQVGSIEAGKFADIIAVPGDPLADISVLEKVSFVMKDGVVIKR